MSTDLNEIGTSHLEVGVEAFRSADTANTKTKEGRLGGLARRPARERWRPRWGPRTLARTWACSLGETGAMEVLIGGGTGPVWFSQDPPACGTENGQRGTEQKLGAQWGRHTASGPGGGWRCLGWGGNSGGSRSGQIRACVES